MEANSSATATAGTPAPAARSTPTASTAPPASLVHGAAPTAAGRALERQRERVYGAVAVFHVVTHDRTFRNLRNQLAHAFDSATSAQRAHHTGPGVPSSRVRLLSEHTAQPGATLSLVPGTPEERVWLTCLHVGMAADFLKEVWYVIQKKNSDEKERGGARAAGQGAGAGGGANEDVRAKLRHELHKAYKQTFKRALARRLQGRRSGAQAAATAAGHGAGVRADADIAEAGAGSGADSGAGSGTGAAGPGADAPPPYTRKTHFEGAFTECGEPAATAMWEQLKRRRMGASVGSKAYEDRGVHLLESLRQATAHRADFRGLRCATNPDLNEMVVVMVYLSVFGRPLLQMLRGMVGLVRQYEAGVPREYRAIAREDMSLVDDYEATLGRYCDEPLATLLARVTQGDFTLGDNLLKQARTFCHVQRLDKIPSTHISRGGGRGGSGRGGSGRGRAATGHHPSHSAAGSRSQPRVSPARVPREEAKRPPSRSDCASWR